MRTLVGCLLVVLAVVGTSTLAGPPAPAEQGGPWRDLSPVDRDALVGVFREQVSQGYAAALTRLEAEQTRRRSESVEIAVQAFSLLVLLAPLALLIPLRQWRRWRGRRLRVAAYGLLATLLFAGTVVAFMLVLTLLKELTLELSKHLDPQSAVLNTTYATLYENAHDMVLREDLPISMTLEQLRTGAQGPLTLQLAQNLTQVHERVFGPAKHAVELVVVILRVLPALLSLGMGLLFAWSIRSVLVRIATMPLRAAAGEPRVAWRTVRATVGSVLREIGAVFAAFPALPLLAVLSAVSMLFLASISVSSWFRFVGAVLACLAQTGATPAAWMAWATCVAPAFLLTCSLLLTATSLGAFAALLAIARDKLHRAVPLRRAGHSWKAWLYSLLKLHALPPLFLVACVPVLHALLPTLGSTRVTTAGPIAATLVIPLGAVALLLLFRVPGALLTVVRPAPGHHGSAAYAVEDADANNSRRVDPRPDPGGDLRREPGANEGQLDGSRQRQGRPVGLPRDTQIPHRSR